MGTYFQDEVQNNFRPDFGFDSPKRTKKECANPLFHDKKLHRVAIMKDYHVGAKGDVEENGLSGWIAKKACTSCGKQFQWGGFYSDKKETVL